MKSFTVNTIGQVCCDENGYFIKLEDDFIPAMKGLDGFGHVQVLWWFDGCDNQEARSKLTEHSPYKNAPDILGTFATRSPMRPNPIALTAAEVTYLDYDNGIIGIAYIDALEGTPVIDIKPYTPSLDRVEHPSVPRWCAGWPDCTEKSGEFDWSSVFNF